MLGKRRREALRRRSAVASPAHADRSSRVGALSPFSRHHCPPTHQRRDHEKSSAISPFCKNSLFILSVTMIRTLKDVDCLGVFSIVAPWEVSMPLND